MKLRRINTLLCIAIVLVNGYILLMPLLPHVLYWLQQRDHARITALTQTITPRQNTRSSTQLSVDGPNRVIIPGLGLEEQIHEGPDAKTLRQGLWLRPQGSTPDRGSNTVIVGHRFTYTQPQGPFYHLDKIRTGERMGVVWDGKLYTYTVKAIKTVHAQQTDIEAPTAQGQLTLYTCTPLWLPKDRLVIIAEAT